jgi:hypothetical protein
MENFNDFVEKMANVQPIANAVFPGLQKLSQSLSEDSFEKAEAANRVLSMKYLTVPKGEVVKIRLLKSPVGIYEHYINKNESDLFSKHSQARCRAYQAEVFETVMGIDYSTGTCCPVTVVLPTATWRKIDTVVKQQKEDDKKRKLAFAAVMLTDELQCGEITEEEYGRYLENIANNYPVLDLGLFVRDRGFDGLDQWLLKAPIAVVTDIVDDKDKRNRLLLASKYCAGELRKGRIADAEYHNLLDQISGLPLEQISGMIETAKLDSCSHEWVNVGFTSVRMVCKKCDKEK